MRRSGRRGVGRWRDKRFRGNVPAPGLRCLARGHAPCPRWLGTRRGAQVAGDPGGHSARAHRPRQALPVSRLHRAALRRASHSALGRRWSDQPGQPHAAVPAPSPRRTRRRLCGRTSGTMATSCSIGRMARVWRRRPRCLDGRPTTTARLGQHRRVSRWPVPWSVHPRRHRVPKTCPSTSVGRSTSCVPGLLSRPRRSARRSRRKREERRTL